MMCELGVCFHSASTRNVWEFQNFLKSRSWWSSSPGCPIWKLFPLSLVIFMPDTGTRHRNESSSWFEEHCLEPLETPNFQTCSHRYMHNWHTFIFAFYHVMFRSPISSYPVATAQQRPVWVQPFEKLEMVRGKVSSRSAGAKLIKTNSKFCAH